MKFRVAPLAVCAVLLLVASGCATKKFVREHVGATETRIAQRVDTQETRLKETTDRTEANAQAIQGAGQQIRTLDGRIGEVGAVATDARGLAEGAKREAETVAGNLKDTDARFANRNSYSTLETISLYFDFARADLKDQGFTDLADVARALKANPNAIVELQGFADPRGSDHYNYQLTRNRVDAVVRYLVREHGIDLRRIHAVGMGKAVRESGEKATRDSLAKSRRVDVKVLGPQS